jgi:hypothetical protein
MHGVMRKPLPFKKSWTSEQLVLASRQYLEQLIDTIYGSGKPVYIIKHLALSIRPTALCWILVVIPCCIVR